MYLWLFQKLERRNEKMNLAKNRNENGELLTIQQTCQLSNLGVTTVRRLAEESGAVRRIGRSYRVNKKIFFEYIENVFAE